MEDFYNPTQQKNAPSEQLSFKLSPWSQIVEQLKDTLDPSEFRSWIEPIEIHRDDAKEIIIKLPNNLFYQGILDRFWDRIEQARALLGLEGTLISLEVDDQFSETTPVKENDSPSMKSEFAEYSNDTETLNFDGLEDEAPVKPIDSDISVKERSGASGKIAQGNRRGLLNNLYTFDNFVIGDSNQFAHATCSAVADNPGMTYNPLFIYGSTGLGKTHLIHAVGLKILANNPTARVTYISSERFMNEMIYCIRFNKMIEFRKKYRSCDLFLVDDIQFISGKDRTQEEFFHTFNSLYEEKKQIVITSDMFPQDIPDIEERLRNRFQWGLIADIQPPSVEHRMAILLNKADQLGINLNQEVCFYIASHAKRNIRELEGALHRIAAFSALQAAPIDMDLVVKTFQNIVTESPKQLTIELIQKLVSEHFKIKVLDLKSKRRQRTLTIPRQIAMYLARTKTKSSFPDIGAKFGGKDHTTVMHAVKKVEADRKSDLDIRSILESLERKIDQSY